MARGFKTGGRIKGSKNKRTLLLEGAARQVQGDAKRILGDEAFEGDAHSLLVLIYKDNSLPLAAVGAAGSHRCPECEAAGSRKSDHRRRLQCHCNADYHPGICDAADRCGGHVSVLTGSCCQCTTPCWRSSEEAKQKHFAGKQSFLAELCT